MRTWLGGVSIARLKRFLPAFSLTAVVIAAVALAVAHGRVGGPVLLGGDQLTGFRLLDSKPSHWFTPDGARRVPTQVWRHLESGASLEIRYALFESPDELLAACESELKSTQAIPEPGSFSGASIGDGCWHWPEVAGSARLLVHRGHVAVSLLLIGKTLPPEAAALLERVAAEILMGQGPPE